MTVETGTRSKPRINPLMIRKIHTYIGVLIAPSMLFFSATGAYQLFGLHEAQPGEAYQPPALLAELSAVHKDQIFKLKHRGPPSPEATKPKTVSPHRDGPPGGDKSNPATLLLKCYFLIVALGMFGTTLLGQYLALKYARSKPTIWALTLIGTAIPIILLIV